MRGHLEPKLQLARCKTREGEWNGGYSPYGYKLENGELFICTYRLHPPQARIDAEVGAVVADALQSPYFSKPCRIA